MNDQPLNPVQIEQRILELLNRIAKGVAVCSDRYTSYLDADREYDRVNAIAYLEAEGSIEDRKRKAEIATTELRAERDKAEALYKHADKLYKALDLELRANQSLGASVRTMYGNAGRGEY